MLKSTIVYLSPIKILTKIINHTNKETVYKPLTVDPEILYLLSLLNSSIGFKDIKNICLRLFNTLPQTTGLEYFKICIFVGVIYFILVNMYFY
jgi:hypothetical protein